MVRRRRCAVDAKRYMKYLRGLSRIVVSILAPTTQRLNTLIYYLLLVDCIRKRRNCAADTSECILQLHNPTLSNPILPMIPQFSKFVCFVPVCPRQRWKVSLRSFESGAAPRELRHLPGCWKTSELEKRPNANGFITDLY